MDFKTGDFVVHHSFGVGTVASIETMELAGSDPRLFYRVEFLKTTVWVPVDDDTPAGLRSVIPGNELPQFRDLLTSSPVLLQDDFRKRQVELERRKDSGSFQSLCEMVRDLSARHRLKPLNQYEKSLLKNSLEALAGEWAVACDLSLDAAQQEIEAHLRQGQQILLEDSNK